MRQHSKQLHGLHSSPSITRVIKWTRMRWAGQMVRICDSKGTYSILVKKLKERHHSGRPWRRCENNTKMYLEEVEWEA